MFVDTRVRSGMDSVIINRATASQHSDAAQASEI